MELLIKVYVNYWSNTPIFSFITKEKITIEEDLDSFGTASFKVVGYELVEYNKIEIYEIGVPDKLVFKGLVYEPNKTISLLTNNTVVQCRSERFIMNSRKILVERNKTDTIENIVNELLADYSSDNFTTAIGLSGVVNIDYKIGDTYDGILDELALQGGGFWDIQNGILRMDTLLGTDKSQGSGMISVVFTGLPGDNIKNISIIGQSTRSNIVIGENSGGTHIEQDLSGGYVYGVSKVRFRDGDLIEKTQKQLDRLNIRQRILNIELDPNKDIQANVGDKLYLEVSNIDAQEDIIGQVLVTKKTIIYDYAEKNIVLHVGENVIKKDGLGDIIVGIKKELDMVS